MATREQGLLKGEVKALTETLDSKSQLEASLLTKLERALNVAAAAEAALTKEREMSASIVDSARNETASERAKLQDRVVSLQRQVEKSERWLAACKSEAKTNAAAHESEIKRLRVALESTKSRAEVTAKLSNELQSQLVAKYQAEAQARLDALETEMVALRADHDKELAAFQQREVELLASERSLKSATIMQAAEVSRAKAALE